MLAIARIPRSGASSERKWLARGVFKRCWTVLQILTRLSKIHIQCILPSGEETSVATLQTTVDGRPTAAAHTAPAVSAKTWLAVIGATLGAFMAVLNIQIVNASLADIQGGIGAGIDDGGWISTSYLIAEIVVIPLSGWLAQVFSIRIYLLTNAFLFLVFSAACALAQDLPQMIALRAVQGFSGGVLIPLAFTLIITLLPKAKQPIGLALFAISATFAPAIGSSIGG